jgi:hypothetical protein
MATRQDDRMIEPDMNPADLWLEEIFTDRRVGTIRRMTPVDGKGERDAGRDIVYVGEMQIMSQMGALPISFQLEAKTLEEAANVFGVAAKAGIERMQRELQELRRQQASSIVVPQGGLPPMPPGGGGKIQMP